MHAPLRITVRGLDHSAALDDHVRERCEKLEQFYAQLIGVEVTVELSERHKHHGNRFEVRLMLRIPGNDIVVDHQHDEDVYVAVRDAFDAASRQLKAAAERNRGSDRAKRRSGTV
jgi:ribosomal subunit interface protein